MPKISRAVQANLETTSITDAALDLANALNHLHAMLVVIYGGGGESFRNCSEGIQDTYLWSCADKAKVCAEQAEALTCRLMNGDPQ